MKNKLLFVLALSTGFLFGGCTNKIDLGGHELNNEAPKEIVIGDIVGKKYLFFYLDKFNKMQPIVEFPSKYQIPISYGFHDFENDGCSDFWYNSLEQKTMKTYILDNENGEFSKKKRLHGQ